ncbi:hypothetical protein T4B_436 [Trichinella pseudospiralis]|uniref:Uncharacterized protein n=2 Tax=Trichinella pseudospiralis TaxID=6337 RepID=A0A0V1FQT8_TRIPS|nr:hypothetical protein T4D_1397 [Trichinella pseudospiralis]KRZ30258.1 hypothetical protein T4B_436 [Trichinella pseudospiralis]
MPAYKIFLMKKENCSMMDLINYFIAFANDFISHDEILFMIEYENNLNDLSPLKEKIYLEIQTRTHLPLWSFENRIMKQVSFFEELSLHCVLHYITTTAAHMSMNVVLKDLLDICA